MASLSDLQAQIDEWNTRGLYVDLISSREGWAARLWDRGGPFSMYRVAWLVDPAPTLAAAIERLAEREKAMR